MNYLAIVAALLLGVSVVLVVAAVVDDSWATSYDGTGSHVGLWRLCWTEPQPGRGGVLTCHALTQAFTISSFRHRGVLNESRDSAAAKWDFLLAVRGGAVGAAACWFIAATAALAGGSRLWFALAAAFTTLGAIGVVIAVPCFAYLLGVWSRYKYTELVLGPDWVVAIVAGSVSLAAAAILLLLTVLPTCCAAVPARKSAGTNTRGSVQMTAVPASAKAQQAAAGGGAAASTAPPVVMTGAAAGVGEACAPGSRRVFAATPVAAPPPGARGSVHV